MNNKKHTPSEYIDFAMKISNNAIDALIYLGVMMANGDAAAEKAYKQLDYQIRNSK
jgi:hypothetical protein